MNDIFGRVLVPLHYLTFENGRQLDERITEGLERVYEKTSCNPDGENRIRSSITEVELGVILRTLNMTRDELRATLYTDSPPPLLEGYHIRCKEGQHRVAAAKLKGNKSACWVIELQRFRGRQFA